ncbi:MAG TPA: acetoacetate--CoA ligase, partial [Thermopetrobacter sp.]|nr:acetoacetate--CoA ligase [Thermopetrobacter sp.]
MGDAPMWRPAPARREASAMWRFMQALPAAGGPRLEDFRALHAWSVADMAAFWPAVWDFYEVSGEKGETPFTPGPAMRKARFLPDAQLNYAANLLRHEGNQPALIWRTEDGRGGRLSRDELIAQVARCQRAMRAAGVRRGERVAGIVSNGPEAVIAFLAAASIGAIWSSASPDFGPRGILDRFAQIEPVLLFVCDAYVYGGKTFRLDDKARQVVAGLPTLREVVVIDQMGGGAALAEMPGGATTWDGFLGGRADGGPDFAPLPFDHPLYILFSSGTTGKPKCFVHRAGGILLKHLCELGLHGDIQAGDRVFYFTTTGWMMWNWLISGLALGATLLLYDGSPLAPDEEVLLAWAEEEGVTHFGCSPRYLDALRKAGRRPAERFALARLRTIFSAGSPLLGNHYDYVYGSVKRDVQLASITGGTDLCGCFVGCNPLEPVWRGEIQGPMLGMAVEVFDEAGRPLRGAAGELGCTRPFPTMPLMFWNDPGEARYRAAYFGRFGDVWHHGDVAEWTAHGGIIVHGRSDATLNPGGVRIGTAELYAQVEPLEEIAEALAIGQKTPDGDERIVLFVRLQEGVEMEPALEDRIRRAIREGASPRHVPAVIVAVADIPRTRSGKISEIAVRDVVHGREPKNIEALANPEALD